MLKTDSTRQGFENIFGWVSAPAVVADSIVRPVVTEAVGGIDLPLCQARKETYILYTVLHYTIRTQFPVVKVLLQALWMGKEVWQQASRDY